MLIIVTADDNILVQGQQTCIVNVVLQQIKSDSSVANVISNVLDNHSDFNLARITHSKPKETSGLVKLKLMYQSGSGHESQAFSVCVKQNLLHVAIITETWDRKALEEKKSERERKRRFSRSFKRPANVSDALQKNSLIKLYTQRLL